MKISSQSLYRDILKRALIITWRNRLLWIFGFFSTFLGLGSIYNFVLKDSWQSNILYNQAMNKFANVSISGLLITENFDRISLGNLGLFILAVIASIVLLLFMIWLAVSSFGALIKASQKLDKKSAKKLKTDKFWTSFSEGRTHFWQLLGTNLLGKIIIFLFLSVTGGILSLILVNNSIAEMLLYFFTSLILIAVSLIVSFLIIYASCLIVLKSRTMLDAIIESWELFKKHWVISIEAAVILFLINLLIKLGLAVLLVLFSIPFMVLLLLFYTASAAAMPTVVIAFWILVAIILMILVGSFFSTFQIVAWTLLFDKINKGGVLSKLQRIFG